METDEMTVRYSILVHGYSSNLSWNISDCKSIPFPASVINIKVKVPLDIFSPVVSDSRGVHSVSQTIEPVLVRRQFPLSHGQRD